MEEEENICDDVIYADPGRRSRCRPKGGGLSLGYAHRVGGFLSGVTTWGAISGGARLISRAYIRHSALGYCHCNCGAWMTLRNTSRHYTGAWLTPENALSLRWFTMPNMVAVGQGVYRRM